MHDRGDIIHLPAACALRHPRLLLHCSSALALKHANPQPSMLICNLYVGATTVGHVSWAVYIYRAVYILHGLILVNCTVLINTLQ